MAHHKQHTHPVPPANQPKGPPTGTHPEAPTEPTGGASFEEQDSKRRLGGFSGAGEHSRKQPSRISDGGTQNR